MSNTPLSLTLPDELLEQLAERVADILEQRSRLAETNDSRWLTVAEAADYLRCSRQRIYDLRSSGRLSRHGDGGRALIDRQELDDLIARGAVR